MKALLLFLALFISSCISNPSLHERKGLADELAQQNGWGKSTLNAGLFNLAAYYPSRITYSDNLTIYIEGDGFSWVTPSQPSSNPTPVNPVGLKLALAHNDGNAAYLARPCQYVGEQDSNCHRRYWTSHRFSPEVIASSSGAIDKLKTHFKARSLTLVGYSGGAAVAALLAAGRGDVAKLITVAGNLDHDAWTRHHKVTPLTGSQNPADAYKALMSIPQIHFVGVNDTIVPPYIVEGFVSRFGGRNSVHFVTVPDYSHHCCWVKSWQEIWARYVQAGTINPLSNLAVGTPSLYR